jgi:ABC-type transport system involved in cytochrome c biogenesis permease component
VFHEFKAKLDRVYYVLYPILIIIFFGMAAGSAIDRQWRIALECFVVGLLSFGVLRLSKKYDEKKEKE